MSQAATATRPASLSVLLVDESGTAGLALALHCMVAGVSGAVANVLALGERRRSIGARHRQTDRNRRARAWQLGGCWSRFAAIESR
jgi:hypothetical protein